MLSAICQYVVMLLAVKTVKSDWCSIFCWLKVRRSIASKTVCCLSVLLMLSIGRLYGAGSCRQRLSGVCSKLVNQLSRVSR